MESNLQEIMDTCRKPRFWAAVIESDTVSRAAKVAALVGTVLVLINQGDVILQGELPPLWKILLTYCVPYAVSAYSAASFKVAYRRKNEAAL